MAAGKGGARSSCLSAAVPVEAQRTSGAAAGLWRIVLWWPAEAVVRERRLTHRAAVEGGQRAAMGILKMLAREVEARKRPVEQAEPSSPGLSLGAREPWGASALGVMEAFCQGKSSSPALVVAVAADTSEVAAARSVAAAEAAHRMRTLRPLESSMFKAFGPATVS
jgi:hypothetical protein